MFDKFSDSGDLLTALVLSASPTEVKLARSSREIITITDKKVLGVVARALNDKAKPEQRIKRGSVVYIRKFGDNWEIINLPAVQAAFVALSPQDGAIRAMVGGFDFYRGNFNRVTQAWRQPGSNIKPFIYAASLERGLTPATQISDLPFELSAAQTGSKAWTPKNYGNQYEPMLTLRQGLYKSKNMVSIRILQAIGPQYGQDYLTRFGFDKARQPAVLPLALGAGSVTPLQVAGAYAVFANGGYRITPYLIDRVTDSNGKVIMQSSRSWPATRRPAPSIRAPPGSWTTSCAAWPPTAPPPARACCSSATTSPARPAPPTNRWTPGSRATRPRWWRPRGWASTSPSRWARARPAAASPCRSGWTTCRPRSGRARGKAAPPPGRHHRRERRILFLGIPAGTGGGPPGPAASRHAGRVPQRPGRRRRGQQHQGGAGRRRQGNAPGRRRYRSDREKAGSDRAGFSWPGRRPTGVRVWSGGGFEKARAADGAMPRGNGYRRIVTGTPAAAEQICDSASGSCGPPRVSFQCWPSKR